MTPDNALIVLLTATSGMVALVSGAWFIVRGVCHWGRRVTDFLDDWQGEGERPGFPARPGFPERLAAVERTLNAVDRKT